jgi:hypothetical protein
MVEETLRDGSQNNAMAECALALAMAFFSIMVLTMVSMGAGAGADTAAAPPTAERLSLRPSAPPDRPAGASTAAEQAILVIHHRGRFYDARLRPLSPDAIPGDGPTILAIAPSLSMADAIAIRERIANPDLTVTTLDARWLEALKDMPR